MLFRKSNRKNKKSQTFNSQETFILEPILTPSGFVDTGDDQPDPVTFEDIDLHTDIDHPDNLLDPIDHSIADLPYQDPSNLDLDTDLEEIPFITTDLELSSPESIEITQDDLTPEEIAEIKDARERYIFAVIYGMPEEDKAVVSKCFGPRAECLPPYLKKQKDAKSVPGATRSESSGLKRNAEDAVKEKEQPEGR